MDDKASVMDDKFVLNYRDIVVRTRGRGPAAVTTYHYRVDPATEAGAAYLRLKAEINAAYERDERATHEEEHRKLAEATARIKAAQEKAWVKVLRRHARQMRELNRAYDAGELGPIDQEV